MTRTSRGLRTLALTTGLLLGTTAARAATFTVYVDADNNVGTGCTAGAYSGIEKVLVTTVDTAPNPPAVTALQQQTCTGGVLGALTAVTPPPPSWNVGSGGLDGTDVVETYLPFTPSATALRLYVDASGGDTLTTLGPGNPAPIVFALPFDPAIPTVGEWGMLLLALLLVGSALFTLRKRERTALLLLLFLGAGVTAAWAAIVLDGDPADWGAQAPLAQDAFGTDPSPDLRALFVAFEQGKLFFRIDALLAQAPTVTTTAGPLTYTEGDPATIIDSAVTAADPDSPVVSGTVTISNAQDGAAEVLAASAGSCVGLVVTPGLNNLGITGSQPASVYQTCLRSVTYFNSSQNPGTTPRTITVVLSDGTASGSATRTINVVAVDDAPVAVADAATVGEDAPATAVAVLTNDTDVDAGPKSIASVTQPANGTVVITGGGTGLTYQPNANYCNNPPGTTLDTFTYTLSPAGTTPTATVTMTVTCADDPPVAVADAATVNQDSGASAIDVLANDTDVDGGPKSVASVTQPANGTVVITGGGTGVSYTPNAGYCNNPPGTTLSTFTYTLTPGSSSTTVSVTVTCNTPPVAVNDAATVNEDSGANAIDVLANDTDVDGGAKSVGSVTQPANGTVVITGGGTGLSYTPNANYCNNPPGTTLDTFTYTLSPAGVTPTATVTVTVTCVDDDPVAVADSATVTEDDPATAVNVLANDTDIDGGPKSVASVTQPANGTVVITGGGTGLTYQPNANYCNSVSGPVDTFTYTLTPGSSSTTVSVTVTCVDDPPTAVNDTATVNEDSGANAIDVLANDTDVDGGPKSVTGVTQPANGTVAITGGGTGVTYTPSANYCNSSGSPDTFTYSLTPGGSSATVSVTVTCIDDPPVAVADAAGVQEDSGANAIDVLANDTDIDGGPKSVASVTQPAFGTVTITGGGTGVSYAPSANYCNSAGSPDTFTYTLSPGGSSTTVSVTVACVDDSPVIDLDANDDKGTAGADFAVTFTEGDAPKLLEDPLDAVVSDIDSANLASLTVTLTNLLDTGFETLAADVTGTAITANYVPATGVLTLTGPDTVANFQTVLRKVTYQNTDNAPDATPRVVHFVANDGNSNSNTATTTITIVAVDSNPTAVADSATVNEDSGASAINVLANDTDPDGGPKSIQSVTQPANGAVVITGGGTGLTYAPNANYCNSVSGPADTFTYTLTPGGSTATVSVTVTCVDDNPTAVADSATVVEDSGANAINVLANDTDPDGGPKSISSVTQPANGVVVITGGGTGLTYAPNANYCNSVSGPNDAFTYTLTPGGSSTTVTVTVTCVDDPPVAVNDAATVTEDDPATAINVLANDTDVDAGPKSIASVTQPAGGTVVITGGGTGLTYQPNANFCNTPPGPASTFTYTLTPGSSTATVSVTVTCVDDPPVAVNDSATVTEDDPATAIPVLANDTDVDGGPKSIQSVTQPTNGTVAITGGGTGLTYKPNANYCNNPPGTTPDTFTYTLTPASATPTATVSVSVICVNDPPLLTTNPITYSTAGNTQLHVAGATLPGVASIADAQSALTKSNPTDVDGPGPLQVVAASGSSANGGSFSIATDGSFTYVPPAGFTGTDTFTYVVTDNGAPAATVTGTVSVTVGQRVWYIRDVVDANNAAGGDGRSTNAFDTIAAFNAATTNNGDIIFVFRGNTGTTALAGGITLKDGQKLWGEGIGLTVAPFGTLVPAGSKPKINNAGGDAVSVPATAGNRQNVEVRGLDLQGSGNAVDVTATGANIVGVTISDNNVSGAGLEGFDLNAGSTGTFAATFNNDAVAATGNGIDIRTTAATTLTVDLSNSAVVSNATGILIDGSGGGTTTITGFANNAISQNTVGTGISITSARFDGTPGGGYQTVSGGTTVIGTSGNGVGASGLVMTNVSGDLAFTDLDVFADGGAAVRVTGTGAVNTGAGTGTRVTVGAGVAIFEAIGGPAVDVTSATIDLQPTSIKSTNSATTGVALNTVFGTFSAGSGSSISGSTGTAFQVGSSNATISYAGTITTTTGKGVDLTGNTGSTISFTGLLTLSSGANTAFNASGAGPAATSGGTVTSTNTSSTITSTTGTALNVVNTTIGAGGLTFRTISAGTAASGPANGIFLNNTGSSGGLTVSGTGSAGSGGTIRKAATGISLTSTSSVSLSWLQLNDFTDHAILGATVNNLIFDHSVVSGTSGDAGTEAAIQITDLTGSASLSNDTISGGYADNVRVANSTGTLNRLTVSGTTIGANDATGGNSALNLQVTSNSPTFNVTITGCTFTASRSTFVQYLLNGTGFPTGDLVFTNNTITQSMASIAGAGGLFVSQSANASPTFTFNIQNNTMHSGTQTITGNDINVSHEFGGSYSGTITGNTLGTTGVANSGSAQGSGIAIFQVGGGTYSVHVTNNIIRRFNNDGIYVQVGDNTTGGNGSLNATITGNTIKEPDSFALHGVEFNVGTTAGDAHAVCADIGGAGALANDVAGSGVVANGGFDLRPRERQNTTIRLPGYGGSGSSTAAIAAFLNGRNTTGGVGNISVSVNANGYAGGAACP